MSFQLKHLVELLKVALKHNASDIHIRTDERPCFRIRGQLTPIQTKEFSVEDVTNICQILMDYTKKNISLDQIQEMDGSFEVEGVSRLRYNILRFQGKLGVILRVINTKVPSIDELQLSPTLKKIALEPRGLNLVTGVTGSGKSTTLSAMVNHINSMKRCHIITIEDPVEFIHPQLKSRVTQREIRTDTQDFYTALRSALRQDPDVISIGEMRDPETMSIALKAAETGHMVLSTIHTTDALTTVNRLISMFPPAEQENVRKRIADNLHSTISQRLLPTADGHGMIAAMEIMITGPGIRDCILGKEDLAMIYTYMSKGKGQTGMQTFDQHIRDLLDAKIITKETAVEAASSEDFLKSLIFT